LSKNLTTHIAEVKRLAGNNIIYLKDFEQALKRRAHKDEENPSPKPSPAVIPAPK
jgi:hypothetical protein